MDKRVVITGMGSITAAGIGSDKLWKAVKEGISSVSFLENVNVEDLQTKVGAQIKDFEPTDYIDKKEARRMDRFTQLAFVAADLAIKQANIDFNKVDMEKTGVIIGTGIGGIETLENQHQILLEKGPKKVSPLFVPMMISNMAAGMVAIKFGMKGFAECVTTACASGANAIGDAFKLIQRGEMDLMVTGGAEAAMTSLAIAGFCSNKTMTTCLEPEKASRPFDKERDGFVMGEGAGILVIEEYEHAIKRNAKIIAEIVGYACTNDAYHITAPAENGEGGARCMRNALKDAKLLPEDIGYINAHGTSTELNDKNETEAIKTVFKDHAYQLAVSSTKSVTGHLLGAAGGIEAIISTMVLVDNFIPPTINYSVPDPECDLDYVPNVGRIYDGIYTMSNSFGFGGHNCSLIFKKI